MLRKKSDTFGKQLQQRNRALESFEEIANTYLKTSAPKTPAASSKKKARVAPWIPWTVAAACLAFASYVLISNSIFDIKIRILNKNAPEGVAASAATGPSGRESYLVKGGQPAPGFSGKVGFQGDATSESKIFSEEVVLANAGGSGAASYRIEFAQPRDLSGAEIGYSARSASEGARLVLVVTDTENRAYRVEDDAITKLSKEWSARAVRPRSGKDPIDLTSIATIRFEFGSSTVGNPSGTTISLRDVYLTKSKRLRWL